MNDLQRAHVGKRIIAAIFDLVLIATLAVGVATALSACFNYDAQYAEFEAIIGGYEEQYGIDLHMTTAKYEAMSEAEQKAYMETYETVNTALQKDTAYTNLNVKLINLRMMMLTFSILAAVLALEFFLPLLLGNGMTLGKKIFGIGVMHVEGIRVTGIQMFIRAVLGKFTLEIMLPLYVALLTFRGGLGIIGIILLAALAIAQIICLIRTRTNAPMHDVFASTVTVDFASQRIFEDREDRDNYIKAIHAEQAARADY